MTSNLSQPDSVQFCYESVNRSCIKSSYSPASRVILYSVWPRVFIGYLWKLLGDDFSSSLQAAAFASQFLDRLSGLRGLSGGSDRDALQHGQVRGELLVLWSQILCPSQFLWCGILLLFSLPPVLHLHRQVHCCYWPSGLSHQVHGVCVCISISWILPIVYSGAVFYTGVSDDGMEELASALNCIWVLVNVLLFFIYHIFYIQLLW